MLFKGLIKYVQSLAQSYNCSTVSI